MEHARWQGNTDGSTAMHRALIWLMRHISLRLVYAFMAVFVVPVYMLVNRAGYRAIYRYFRRRHGLGRLRAFGMTYRNHYRFGQVILDRFAAYAGKRFEFEIDGESDFDSLYYNPGSFIILGSHVGNYEMVGYSFDLTRKHFNVVMFGGEAQEVMANKVRLFNSHNIDIITVADDLSHVFQINRALDAGDILSIHGDRLFGSSRYVECELLGATARLPMGPYAIAAQRDVPAIAMFAIKLSTRRYRLYIRPIRPEGYALARRIRDKIPLLAREFARQIDDILTRHPEQWFNYYDFWQNDD